MSDDFDEADFEEEDFQEAPDVNALRHYEEIVFCPVCDVYMPYKVDGAIVRRQCPQCRRLFEGGQEVSTGNGAKAKETEAGTPGAKAPAAKKAAKKTAEKAPAKKAAKKEAAEKAPAKKTAAKKAPAKKSAAKKKAVRDPDGGPKKARRTASASVAVAANCAALTKAGGPCSKPPRAGSKYCTTHKGYRPRRS